MGAECERQRHSSCFSCWLPVSAVVASPPPIVSSQSCCHMVACTPQTFPESSGMTGLCWHRLGDGPQSRGQRAFDADHPSQRVSHWPGSSSCLEVAHVGQILCAACQSQGPTVLPFQADRECFQILLFSCVEHFDSFVSELL